MSLVSVHRNRLLTKRFVTPAFGKPVATPTASEELREPRIAMKARRGGKARLLGISKRGNEYLRRMFIHGARAVLYRVKYDTGGFGRWVHQLEARAPRNKIIVAIANKLARIAWAVLFRGEGYQHQPLVAA